MADVPTSSIWSSDCKYRYRSGIFGKKKVMSLSNPPHLTLANISGYNQ